MKDHNTDNMFTVTVIENDKSCLESIDKPCTVDDLANLISKRIVSQMWEDIKVGKYPSFGNVEDWKAVQTKLKLNDIEEDFK